MMGGNEEEMLAYASLLSQETLEQENLRRGSDTSTVPSAAASTDQSTAATGNVTPSRSPSPPNTTPKSDGELDADIAEAIRQSLATSPTVGAYAIPIRHARPKGRKGSPTRPSTQASPMLAGSSKAAEMTDLEFALQLSLAEEQSKNEAARDGEGNGDGFPALGSPWQEVGKGKGRMR